MIAWKEIAEELGISDSDDDIEGMIHEIAHAYDCIGSKAFRYIGGQRTVGAMIDDKYGDDGEASGKAEVRASAVTRLVLGKLGELTPSLEYDIASSMMSNMPSEWNRKHYNISATEALYEKTLADPKVLKTAGVIAKFLLEFPVDSAD